MIDNLRAKHTVTKLCDAFDVAVSGYYSYLKPTTSKRALQDVEIRRLILRFHQNAPTYGLDPLFHDVREVMICGRNRVRRLMNEMNIHSIRKRRFRVFTTNSKHKYCVAANLVKGVVPEKPNQIWVRNITYIPTDEGFLYLAAVKDKYTREIIGYTCGDEITSNLTSKALFRAIELRKPEAGLIHHSDRGVQYCCHAYRDILASHGIIASMSRKGNPYDNAMAENFFSCIKCERLLLEKYATRRDAQLAVFEYIDGFYNRRRRHGALGWRTLKPILRGVSSKTGCGGACSRRRQ